MKNRVSGPLVGLISRILLLALFPSPPSLRTGVCTQEMLKHTHLRDAHLVFLLFGTQKVACAVHQLKTVARCDR